MQPVDFTTLMAACAELRSGWLPARMEQVYQRDRFTLSLALRTLDRRDWLTISWHPQAARLHIGEAPPRTPDTFTFSEQLRHQLNGLALTAIAQVEPWERVVDLQFGQRPGDEPIWHLYVEIMGQYSNVILANQKNVIVSVAHQVSEQQSSVRPILTGQPYVKPPRLTDPIPTLAEPFDQWRDRIRLVPGKLVKMMVRSYRGLSSALVRGMIGAAGLNADQSTDELNDTDWQRLHQHWQEWLTALAQDEFNPGWLEKGYTVMGWEQIAPAENVQVLLRDYYRDQTNQQEFNRLRQQLSQKLSNFLKKATQKANTFRDRIQQSDEADTFRQQADLLMAYLHEWQPGMQTIRLNEFETGQEVAISLNPEKNAVQNAQALYKRHQKLKRARQSVEPLLAEVNSEIQYLEQVEDALDQVQQYQQPSDLWMLEEIRDELVQQGYMDDPNVRAQRRDSESTEFYRFPTPGGFELWIGRNNRQNDLLTFRVATEYDIWFHTQEIPGSHALLRLDPGAVPDQADLQFAANLTAYFSRARQSDQAPVIYTEPKHVYKPKGAKPGMVIYKHEQVIWGEPQQGKQAIEQFEAAQPKVAVEAG
ncbi:MAG: Rqc2 family fibronectin-binding protein [Thainema sp.]